MVVTRFFTIFGNFSDLKDDYPISVDQRQKFKNFEQREKFEIVDQSEKFKKVY